MNWAGAEEIVVKNADCSSRGLWFNSQCPHKDGKYIESGYVYCVFFEILTAKRYLTLGTAKLN